MDLLFCCWPVEFFCRRFYCLKVPLSSNHTDQVDAAEGEDGQLIAEKNLKSVVWQFFGFKAEEDTTNLICRGSRGDTLSVSIYLSLVVSLTALVALVVLLVNCVTCCKEQEINFKEFEDHFDDEIDFTPPAEDTPSMQSPAEVYTLAVSPVALPGPPHLQPPPRISEGTSFQVARHSLSYIQEIGNGWFGKVLLSEIYTDPGAARVVVKELKANGSAKEQNEFLQQGDPYRVLQHPNILQCLGQCVEAIPFLLVFEYCEMGDLRGYLSQQDWMFRNAELLQLQRMACEIAAGVTHLHKHNFLHSDLALRNCYLTADLTVKVGDYGIGPYRYKEDYIITEDDVFAPLRWLAPELVGERHGGVITMEQTKPSNVWALGVTLWELFENATQPYPHLSDREVLTHVIKEQQIKLFKPQLELPYSDRWHEVLQFCWLSPDKRATAEEVHRL
ncbi:serine/threonine-protein kinase LMTK2-like, partial [Diretmus argenteus]